MWHHLWLRRRIGREGTLKFIILWLLSEQPRNGVEIINEIEKLSWGWWRPSPGSVYPTLASLTNEGLIVKRQDGRYQITEKGIEEIEDIFPIRKARKIEDILNEIEGYIQYLEEVGKDKLINYKEKIESLKLRIEKLI
ncbi:MAG: PadR family transcriptional regulator [Thermoproteota archaeon]|jgi:DNA-binding PadR family transcriptional regulator|nr:PadR family transcriptional regulator [Thermoproteota archaeon]